jgi:hypothetical protein
MSSTPKFVPRPHQEADLLFAAANPRSANLSEPGTGKTPTAVALTEWYVTSLEKKVVWCQPNSLRKKNYDEILRFSDLTADDVELLDKADVTLGKRARAADPRADPETGFVDYIQSSNARVFVVGYKFFSRYWQRLLEAHPTIDLLIGDEPHLPGGWATHDSQSTNAMFGALRQIKGFYPMTGSLIKGKLGNAYPIIAAIEPRYYGSWRGFLSQHAGYIDDFGRVLYWQNQEKVTKILQTHAVRHTFEEVYGKQARIYETELIDMEPKMRESYNEFAEMASLELENSFLDGSQPGVAAIRARQIMAHPETFGLCKGETSGKDQRLEIHAADHVGEGGLLVFASLVPEVERCAEVCRAAGLSVGVIHGGVSDTERNRIDQSYRDGTLDCICATYGPGGVGWNWQRTRTVICASLNYGDDSLEQAIRRGERDIRDHPLRIIFFQYANSIDQHIEKIVKKYQEVTKEVMQNV